MATVKVAGNVVQNVGGVRVFDEFNGNGAVVILADASGVDKIRIPVKVSSKLRVDVNGNINNAVIDDCCTVYGNVTRCAVKNTLKVEGSIGSCKGYARVNKYVHVENPPTARMGRANVVHVDGDVAFLMCRMEETKHAIVIRGCVQTLDVGENAQVKGNILTVSVSGHCEVTMGRSYYSAKADREYKAERAELIRRRDAMLANIAGLSGSFGSTASALGSTASLR